MPKLPPLTPDKVIKILERKGFTLDRVRGSHHIYYNPVTKKRVIVPLHKRELPKGTLLEILRQADISRDEFAELL
nr:type II toxin-antitoxin system HicA family toxin [Candidatus Njordarchaeum guaymaensis]